MAGSVAKRANGKWLARYRDDAKKEHTKTFDTKREGQRWLDEVTTSVLTGQYVDPRNSKTPLRTYVELWRLGKIHRDTTAAQIDSRLNGHILPQFGDRPIGAIRRTEIQNWTTGLSKTMKGSSVRVIFGTLFSVLEAATEDRVIGSNPARGIVLPKRAGQVQEILTTDQVLTLEDETDDRFQALIRLMAGTGLRPGEATGLTEDRLRWLKRDLVVDRQLNARWGHGSTAAERFGPPKTESGYRTVPMPQTVIDSLSAHVSLYGTGPEGVLFWNPKTVDTKGGGFVHRDMLRRIFVRARDKAGLPDWVTPHDLRHYYASLLIAHGENVKVVQERLGHASAKVTLDTYSHLWPGQEDSTRSAIDSVLGARADYLRTERHA